MLLVVSIKIRRVRIAIHGYSHGAIYLLAAEEMAQAYDLGWRPARLSSRCVFSRAAGRWMATQDNCVATRILLLMGAAFCMGKT